MDSAADLCWCCAVGRVDDDGVEPQPVCLAGLVGFVIIIRPSPALGAGDRSWALKSHRRPDGGLGRTADRDRGRRLVRARLSGWWRTSLPTAPWPMVGESFARYLPRRTLVGPAGPRTTGATPTCANAPGDIAAPGLRYSRRVVGRRKKFIDLEFVALIPGLRRLVRSALGVRHRRYARARQRIGAGTQRFVSPGRADPLAICCAKWVGGDAEAYQYGNLTCCSHQRPRFQRAGCCTGTAGKVVSKNGGPVRAALRKAR